MFDDHEILNDWDKGATEPRFLNGMDVYDEYNAFGNPVTNFGVRYYSFSFGRHASYFVFDTRSHRDWNRSPPTIIGKGQLDDFKTWFSNTKTTVQFLVSSVPWTRVLDRTDSWTGFPNDRDEILNFVKASGKKNVVFLSGDNHSIIVSKISKQFVEYSASPTQVTNYGM